MRARDAEAEIERLRAIEIEGGIAAELVGKIAEIVGARPVFASDRLSQEELLTAVRKLKTDLELTQQQVAAYQANEHACEMKMIRGVAEAQERMSAAEAKLAAYEKGGV
jgi:hypothetical protein